MSNKSFADMTICELLDCYKGGEPDMPLIIRWYAGSDFTVMRLIERGESRGIPLIEIEEIKKILGIELSDEEKETDEEKEIDRTEETKDGNLSNDEDDNDEKIEEIIRGIKSVIICYKYAKHTGDKKSVAYIRKNYKGLRKCVNVSKESHQDALDGTISLPFTFVIDLNGKKWKKILLEKNIITDNKKRDISEVSLAAILFLRLIIEGPQYEKKDEDDQEKIPNYLRGMIWEKYYGSVHAVCMCCGITKITAFDFECAHIISIKNGGKTEAKNLIPACKCCWKLTREENVRDYMKKQFSRNFDQIAAKEESVKQSDTIEKKINETLTKFLSKISVNISAK